MRGQSLITLTYRQRERKRRLKKASRLRSKWRLRRKGRLEVGYRKGVMVIKGNWEP